MFWALLVVAYFILASTYFWLDQDKVSAERRHPGWLNALGLAAYSPILVPIMIGQFVFTYLIAWPLLGTYRAYVAVISLWKGSK